MVRECKITKECGHAAQDSESNNTESHELYISSRDQRKDENNTRGNTSCGDLYQGVSCQEAWRLIVLATCRGNALVQSGPIDPATDCPGFVIEKL